MKSLCITVLILVAAISSVNAATPPCTPPVNGSCTQPACPYEAPGVGDRPDYVQSPNPQKVQLCSPPDLSAYSGNEAERIAQYLGLSYEVTQDLDSAKLFAFIPKTRSNGLICCDKEYIGDGITDSWFMWIGAVEAWSGSVDFTKPATYTLTCTVQEVADSGDCPNTASESITLTWNIEITHRQLPDPSSSIPQPYTLVGPIEVSPPISFPGSCPVTLVSTYASTLEVKRKNKYCDEGTCSGVFLPTVSWTQEHTTSFSYEVFAESGFNITVAGPGSPVSASAGVTINVTAAYGVNTTVGITKTCAPGNPQQLTTPHVRVLLLGYQDIINNVKIVETNSRIDCNGVRRSRSREYGIATDIPLTGTACGYKFFVSERPSCE